MTSPVRIKSKAEVVRFQSKQRAKGSIQIIEIIQIIKGRKVLHGYKQISIYGKRMAHIVVSRNEDVNKTLTYSFFKPMPKVTL